MEHLTTIAELTRSLIELVLAVCAFMSGLWMLWRKVNKAIDKYTVQVDKMAEQFQGMVSAQLKITEAICMLSGKMDMREKDVARLEGALDSTRKDMLQLIASIQQTTGSLDGLWRTLQVLHPSQVPKRASDRG